MATINSHEASPSTSRRYFAAYFTLRGDDTRHGFIDDLLRDLGREVLRTRRDDHDVLERDDHDELEIEDITPEQQKAIEGCRISIIMLSENYVSSIWCLEELVITVKCRSSRHSVIPVFLDVNLSEGRMHTGSFEEVIMRHERRIEMEMSEQKEYLKGKVQEWRMGIKEAEDLERLQFSPNIFEADEIHFIWRFCVEVSKIVARTNHFCAFRLEDERTRGKRSSDEISSHVLSLDILQQHFGNKREDVAKSLGISVSTLKRHCRYHGIPRWPNPIRNNAVYSEIEAARSSSTRVFQLEGQTTQSTNREGISSHVFSLDNLQPHFGSKREDVAKSLGTVYSEIEAARGSSKRVFQLEDQTTQSTNWEGISSHVFSLDILQPHFGSKREDVAKSLGISVSTLKRICRNLGILRWPNRIRSSVSGLPNPYGEKNPLPTFNTLSTNGQITMENEVGGQNLEPNECLPDSFEDPNFQNTRIGSIAEFDKTPTLSDSVPDHCCDANFCISAAYSETEAAGGSSECVFQLQGQTTQSTAYSNRNALVFPQPQIASEEVLNENGGSSEDRRDLLASQAEAILEGNVSEFSNLTVLACSDAAAPYQTFATMPNEFMPDSFQDPSFWNTGQDSIVEVGKTFHDSFLGNYCGVDFRFSSVDNETEATGGSSKCAFQLQGQTTQFPAYPIPDDVSPLQIAPTEVLSGNMGSSEDGRILLASLEASQEDAFSGGRVFESNNLTVPACSDAAAPSQHLATILHPMPTTPSMVTHHIGGSSEFHGCPNLSGIVDAHPQIASTQILSENMGTSEDWSIFLVSQEPFMEESGSGSNNQTIPSCLDPAPSQQPMMPPLIASQDTSSVRVKATDGHTIIAFKLSFASGIIQLKEEVSKRLGFELGNFNLKYKDADGDLVSIACDDDVRDYLQLLTSLGNQVSKLFVS